MISLRCVDEACLVQLDDGTRIGGGGEGAIYPVAGESGRVAKLYKEPRKRSQTKIAAMLRNPPRDHRRDGHVTIAWPTDILVEPATEQFRGFLMKRVPLSKPLHNFIKPGERKQVHPGLGHKHMHVIAANLASVFQALHESGYVVGDVNEVNVLVTTDCLVSIVDTDSFQVRDPQSGQLFKCPVGRPQFAPPEMHVRLRSKVELPQSHDLFGLAVLLFELLMEGSHPFDGIGSDEQAGEVLPERRIAAFANFAFGHRQSPIAKPPLAPPLSSLDPALQQMFSRCFEEGLRDPSARPTAQEWRRAINAARERLRGCSRRNTHAYTKSLNECPYCAVDDDLAGRAWPAKTIPQRSMAPTPRTTPSTPSRRSAALDPDTLRMMQAGISIANRVPPGASWQTTLRMGAESLVQYLLEHRADNLAHTQAVEVTPGRWRLTPYPNYQNAPGLGLLMPADLTLGAGGILAGELSLYAGGVQVGYALEGQWHYDASKQVLSLNVHANMLPAYFSSIRGPAPPQFQRQLALSLSPGAGASLDATNLSVGWRATLQRM